MAYPNAEILKKLAEQIEYYSQLMHEYGAENIQSLLDDTETKLTAALETLKTLPVDQDLLAKEPDDLEAIKALRPDGPRKMWNTLDKELYLEKLEGAFLSRMAGCILGAPVEFWPVEKMEEWAAFIGDAFPPTDYWTEMKAPCDLRYERSTMNDYTRSRMCHVPVDDDITYTMLGLLIAEDHGLDFTTEDVGKAWLKYLPYACTAEEVALDNLRKGIPADQAADIDNPYCQWIGADIRSDPWAYLAPGYPEKAAEFAYRDAYLSHRRNGIYGEMFFAAAQSAAFCTDNAIDAIKIGLTEIPADCALAKDVAWALEVGPSIKDYKQARAAVDERFAGMNGVHTNLNACLSIFGLMIGGNDMSKVISETVAMGQDNDCTAATVGSIIGAIVGKAGVPERWYKPFNNLVRTYMYDREYFEIDDSMKRFLAQVEKLYTE